MADDGGGEDDSGLPASDKLAYVGEEYASEELPDVMPALSIAHGADPTAWQLAAIPDMSDASTLLSPLQLLNVCDASQLPLLGTDVPSSRMMPPQPQQSPPPHPTLPPLPPVSMAAHYGETGYGMHHQQPTPTSGYSACGMHLDPYSQWNALTQAHRGVLPLQPPPPQQQAPARPPS